LCDRFGLTEAQSDAILETKLYRLGKLEILDILGDLEKASARLAEIQALLGDVTARWAIVDDELSEVLDSYGDARRTTIEAETAAAAIEFRQEDYIVDEDAWVIVSRDGWLKRQKSFTEIAAIRVRDDDALGWVLRCRARQSVTFFSNRGVAYTMRANEIALTTGHGDPVQKFFQFDDGERIVSVTSHDPRCLPKHEAPPPRESDDPPPVDGPNLWNGQENERPPDEPVTQGLLLEEMGSGDADSTGSDAPAGPYGVAFTAGGKCLRFSLASYMAVSNRKGRQYMRPDPANTPDDEVIAVFVSGGREHVCLASVNARVIIFPVWEIPVVGGAAKGVLAIKLAYGDRVLGAILADSKREGLTVKTTRGAEKVIRATRYPVTRRGGRGLTVLQREGFESIVAEPVEPLPSLESIANES